ncbi:MAG: LemA family protein [Patescibacteria group bacterium]|nr:LemA family protein [Patescibacteria group bacterium]
MIIVYILLGVLAVVALWFIGTYNGLITLKNRTDEAWSDIDVQLKRRHDLIPNLVETVKGYAGHEKQLFENVTAARSAAMGAKTPEEAAKAENALSATLKTLFAVAENYPQLRASENFTKLQEDLTDTENKVQASRRFYNGNVRDFNTKIQVFPTNMIAGMLGFKNYQFFEIEAMERETPEVKF